MPNICYLYETFLGPQSVLKLIVTLSISSPMAKTDRGAFRSSDWPKGHHGLTIRISHRGPMRLLRSRPAQRLICLILALGGLQLYLLHHEYSSALAAKYSPTVFTRLPLRDDDVLGSIRWHVDANEQKDREQLLSSRDQWKRLGSGCEGDTFSFNNSVIKVFKPLRSPLRNCVPNTASKLRWPSEIPVSLLLGGRSDQRDGGILYRADFLPVYDYFLLPTRDGTHREWYLVTPLVKTGTLEHLAKRLRNQNSSQTAGDIDARYRPSFNRLLKALNIMHSQNLCHDDIKMDNVFVTDSAQPSGNTSSQSEEEAHWLLADLGNTRQANHSYHSSLLWAHDNRQNADCRTNDVVRLLKSYLLFLQAAVGDGDPGSAFNRVFLTASESWSRLYWYTINSARGHLDGRTVAREILKMSTRLFAPAGLSVTPETRQDASWGKMVQPRLQDLAWSERIWLGFDGVFKQRAALVEEQLRIGMRGSERWARIYGTLGILPIPIGQC